MGPHSFKCGKFSEMDSGATTILSFNGAALFQVRKAEMLGAGLCGIDSLQWGRTLSSAESSLGPIYSSTNWSASMGPHSFKCGKLVCAGLCFLSPPACFNGAALFQVRKAVGPLATPNTHLSLQWGRTLSSAESIVGSVPYLLAFSRFNGAALFQVRKVIDGAKDSANKARFNGAALFQVRKVVK